MTSQVLGSGVPVWLVVCPLVWSGTCQATVKVTAATGVSSDTPSPLPSSLAVGSIQLLAALGLSLKC